jgi:phosphoglycolate phosphatase-like HAD superfamily hydrolase
LITECILAANSKPKPAPDALINICTQYTYLPSEILFVGDAPTDRLAADAAGIDFMDAIHFRELLKQ